MKKILILSIMVVIATINLVNEPTSFVNQAYAQESTEEQAGMGDTGDTSVDEHTDESSVDEHTDESSVDEHTDESSVDEHTDEESHDHGEHGAMIMSQDGSVTVHIDSDEPAEGVEAVVTVEFVDVDENAIEHVNFEISATQDGTPILAETAQHAHEGSAEFTTSALSSNSPLDVQVRILGIGLPDDEANWTGPIGETVSAQVVPEFGPLAMTILAVAIVSIVAVTARSKVIPRL